MKYKIGDVLITKSGSLLVISSITERVNIGKQTHKTLPGTTSFYGHGDYMFTDEDILGKVVIE